MTTKSKVPQIRFKGFSGEWEKFEIQKLIDDGIIISHLDGNHGELYPRSEEFIKYGIPYVTANDFITGKVNLKNCKCLSLERASLFKKGIAKDGDILFAHNATVGPVALLTTTLEYVILSTTATYFRCDNINLINSYLKSYFNTNHFILQYSKVMAQSTRNQVPITTQRLFYIQLPNQSEQTKIGNYFQQLDKLIEQKEKKYQKLKQFKKAMLDKMFPKNGADTPEIRFKGFSGKWVEKKLGELIEFIVDNRGKNPRYYCNEGIPVIDNFMIKNNYHPNLREATRFIDDNLFNNFIRKYVNPNDTIITLVGNGIGNITLVPKEKSVIIQNTLGLRFSNEKIFMFYCLLSKNKEIKHLDRGMAQPSIRQDELLDIEIKVPTDTKEQEKIGNYFQKLDNQIDLQQKELEKLKNIKKASLSKMFV